MVINKLRVYCINTVNSNTGNKMIIQAMNNMKNLTVIRIKRANGRKMQVLNHKGLK
jgi:hypothetical protein